MNFQTIWKAIGAFCAYILTVVAGELGIELENPAWLSELLTAVAIAVVVYFFPRNRPGSLRRPSGPASDHTPDQ